MPSYQVKFFKRLVNSNGKRFTVLQKAITVPKAANPAEAELLARRQFSVDRQVLDWHRTSDLVETTLLE